MFHDVYFTVMVFTGDELTKRLKESALSYRRLYRTFQDLISIQITIERWFGLLQEKALHIFIDVYFQR